MQVCRCSKGTRHLTLQVINSNDSVMKTGCTYLRPVFYFYFHEILVDSRLATRRIGEQKFCRLQLLAPPTIWLRLGVSRFLHKFGIDMNEIVVLLTH